MGHYNSFGCYSMIENHERILNKGVRVVYSCLNKFTLAGQTRTVWRHRGGAGRPLRSRCNKRGNNYGGGRGMWELLVKGCKVSVMQENSGPPMHSRVTTANNTKITTSMA